jgi:FHA domain
VTQPKISFRTDERLRLGEFGIQARLVRPPAHEHEEPSQGDEGHTMVYSVSDRVSEPLREPDPRRPRALLRIHGRAEPVGAAGAVLGRSRDNDVVIDDPNVSRHHAEVRPSGGSWIVNDLGSTNGIKVNGRRVDGPQSLKRGDVIELGTSRVTFELE